MMTVSVEGNESVQVCWDGLGRFVNASVVGWHQEDRWASAVEERPVDDKAPADFNGSSLVLLTKTPRSGPPAHGYLVPSSYGKVCPCLRVGISGERDPANPQSIVHGKVTCTAGVLVNAAALGFTIQVTMKRTAKRNLVQALFRSVPWFEVYVPTSIEAQARLQEGFHPIGECMADNGQRKRLAMILYAEFWRRIDASKEAKRSYLTDLGIECSGASSVATIFDRLGVAISGI